MKPLAVEEKSNLELAEDVLIAVLQSVSDYPKCPCRISRLLGFPSEKLVFPFLAELLALESVVIVPIALHLSSASQHDTMFRHWYKNATVEIKLIRDPWDRADKWLKLFKRIKHEGIDTTYYIAITAAGMRLLDTRN